MPDLNYGINIGLPPTRKQLHQRLGRVGRTRPGTFILFGPDDIFTRHNEKLADYYTNSVEPSRLHLSNVYIVFNQALCFTQEHPPKGQGNGPESLIPWPPILKDALDAMVQKQLPTDLQRARVRSRTTPQQLAYGLRSSGEENIQIIPHVHGQDEPSIDNISPQMASKEAYPGAVYRHN